MRNEWQKGASNLSGILIIIFLLFIMLSGRSGDSANSSIVPGTSLESSAQSSYPNSRTYLSPGKIYQSTDLGSQIQIGSGNAPYAIQSYEEYITLENSGRSPINITGWQLRNGKDQRPYNTGGSLQRFSADVALIPQAARSFSTSGPIGAQDVVLSPGEQAIVTTGSVGARTPYAISSFKENMCTGYLEELPDYAFSPSLYRGCPYPGDEPGLEKLDVECRRFVERLSPCETPKFGERDERGDYCADCIDGELLSNSCRAFIKERFSYQGCLAQHQNDPNFGGKTWRIFLGRGWEMWAEDYESIELFDRFGQLVNFENY